MWPSSFHRRKVYNRKVAVKMFTEIIFFIQLLGCFTKAQIPAVQQIHFVPKSYFLQQQQQQTDQSSSSSLSSIATEPVAEESSIVEHSHPFSSPSSSSASSSSSPTAAEVVAAAQSIDISRSPRHLAPDRYYVGPSSAESANDEEDQSATATTSLRANALDRAGNPIRFSNGLIDPHQELKLHDRRRDNPNSNHFEAKILPHSQSSASPTKSRRYKNRRLKTRPPKNVIIYSLPEQSFYARPQSSEDTSYSEPDSREANNGLRSDGQGEEAQEQQQQQQPQQADSKEFRAAGSNLLSQKKQLLGQCMAQCLDAIL